jgi:hypothetical protein
VFSYQNVTVICLLSETTSLSFPTQNRRPRFSFFSYSFVKELTIKTVKKSLTRKPKFPAKPALKANLS